MNLNLALYFSLFMLCFSLSITCLAQRPTAYLRAAEEAMEGDDYYTALHYYSGAYEQDPTTATAYKMAQAGRLFKAYETALSYYQTVLASEESSHYPDLPFYIGFCHKAMGDCNSAKPFLEQYANQRTANTDLAAEAQALVRACNWMVEQASGSTLIVNRLYKRINTPYAEFAPYLSGDTLFYTSYKFELEDDDYQPARKIAKVMLSTDFRRGRVVSRGFNTDTSHTAHTVISTNKQQLFFTKCQFTEGAAIRCDLCVRKKDRRRRWGAAFSYLPAPINLPNYTNTQPAIIWDSLTNQEILLFVSDRPGGAGGRDIWKVAIPADGKNWETPQPLEEINTSADEMSPYFDASSQTLFFSSNRQPNYGGFDVFQSTKTTTWSVPKILPKPINSSYDDHYFASNDGGETGFLSSNRPGGIYLDEWTKTCCPDIFRFKTEEPIIENPDSTDFSITQIEENPNIPVLDFAPEPPPLPNTLEEFLPLALYFDNDEPDPRTRRTTTRKSYGDSYEAYSERENDYYEQFEKAEEQEEIEAFFTDEVHRGFQKLDRFSNILLNLLEEEQTIEIFLKGFTSPRAKSDYNLLLGKRRVNSVRNHFLNWQDGVLNDFLKNGQLIISEVSFGETQAASTAQDEKAGERLSIYSPEAARERRVEIVEIRREE